MPQTPTRFSKGVGNVSQQHPLFMFVNPDPHKWFQQHDDFVRFAAAEWTITRVGTTPTEALSTTEDGGALLLTTTTGATDSTFLASVGAKILISSGQQNIGRIRFKLSDSTNSQFQFGLMNVSPTAFAPTDGIYFNKATAAQTVDLVTASASTATTTSAIATLADATFVELGWYADGAGNISYYVNGRRSGTVTLTNPAVVLSPAFGIKNGAGAAKTATIDFFIVTDERPNIGPDLTF
jgi:hypothetical protein